METPVKQRSLAVKIAITLAVVIIAAAVAALVQQLLFGKMNVAVTSAVIAVSTVSMWRQLWMKAK